MALDSQASQSRNLAASAGRWSARHRGKVIAAWLAFVFVSVLVGGALGMKEIADEDLGSGQSKQADQLVADGFPDRANEEVLIQGRGDVTPADPRFKAAVNDVVTALSGFETVRAVQSPLAPGNAAQVLRDSGRSALVTFDLLGDEVELEDRVTAVQAAVARVQEDHPDVRVESFGDASADKALATSSRRTSRRPRCSRCRSRS